MFSFNFDSKEHIHNKDTTNQELTWLPSNEVFMPEGLDLKSKQNNVNTVTFGSETLTCVKTSTIFEEVNNEVLQIDEDVFLAEKTHSDLVPSKYEGGLKLWECTFDLAEYLSPSLVSGKTVVDLGCGMGLLGILSLKMGAHSVIFQDYNADVLRYATMPNVQINVDPQSCRFFCGDWSSFAQLVDSTYDVIISSETIYNPDNYGKLHDAIQKILKPTGIALLGAKSYYFGVGGSTRQFEKLVNDRSIFNVEVVWSCSQGVQREILKLTYKD